jgi:hypothetical protein
MIQEQDLAADALLLGQAAQGFCDQGIGLGEAS